MILTDKNGVDVQINTIRMGTSETLAQAGGLMESSMVNSNNILIKDFFQKEFPEFSVLSENTYSMFWEIILSNHELEVKLSGDAGGFSISVFIEKTEFPLWQYDRKVNEIAKTKDENILSQLFILSKLIKELNNETS